MTPTREETMPTPTPVPVPTREEIVKLLRDVVWALTDDARSHAERGLVKQRVIRTADALDAAPVLTFEEKVRQATNAARKASPAFTQRFASATADRIIRAALRAAGVQE